MSSNVLLPEKYQIPKPISAKAHGFIDYGHAAFFFGMALVCRKKNPRAAVAALVTGGFVLVQSLLTDYPLGAKPALSFNTHGKMDAAFVPSSAFLPEIFGFRGTKAANIFRVNSIVESAVVALTDWDSDKARSARAGSTETLPLDGTRLILSKLVDTLRDSHQGFLEFEPKLQNPEAKRVFNQETTTRANFAGELENELHRLGVKDVHQNGMLSGKLHRAWGKLKSSVSPGDYEILASAEQGEDTIKRAYQIALAQHLPSDIRDLLARQQQEIQKGHDTVKALRDAAKELQPA